MALVLQVYTDGALVTGINADSSGPFILSGGLYGFTAVGTFSSTNMGLNKLGPDGSTYVAAFTPLTTNGYITVYLPPGTYEFSGTSTSCDASIQRIKLT